MTQKLSDPADAAGVDQFRDCCTPTVARRQGYGAVDLDDVLARVDRYAGNGLRPSEVLALATEVRRLREVTHA